MTAANLLFIIALLCMAATLGVFLFGIVAMTKGGEADRQTSNKMMRMRVFFQGLAIFFLFLAYLAK